MIELFAKVDGKMVNLGTFEKWSAESEAGLNRLNLNGWIHTEPNGCKRLTIKAWSGIEEYEYPIDYSDIGGGRTTDRHKYATS